MKKETLKREIKYTYDDVLELIDLLSKLETERYSSIKINNYQSLIKIINQLKERGENMNNNEYVKAIYINNRELFFVNYKLTTCEAYLKADPRSRFVVAPAEKKFILLNNGTLIMLYPIEEVYGNNESAYQNIDVYITRLLKNEPIPDYLTEIKRDRTYSQFRIDFENARNNYEIAKEKNDAFLEKTALMHYQSASKKLEKYLNGEFNKE